MKKIDLLIIGLLKQKSMHGYQIIKVAENRHLIGWSEMKQSSIYKQLQILEKKEMISSNQEVIGNKPPRKVYSVTTSGAEKFCIELKLFLSKVYENPNRDFMIGISFMTNSLEKNFVKEMLIKRISYLKEVKRKVTKKTENLIIENVVHFPNKLFMQFGIKYILLNIELMETLLQQIDNKENENVFLKQEVK